MLNNLTYAQEIEPYKMLRNFSNSNPSLELSKSTGNNSSNFDAPIGTMDNAGNGNGIHVEYELSVPIIQSFRHTPYHSLWNLNQWFAIIISIL